MFKIVAGSDFAIRNWAKLILTKYNMYDVTGNMQNNRDKFVFKHCAFIGFSKQIALIIDLVF